MTDEEKTIISQFIARVGGSPATSSFGAGSVPQTQPALPPVDREADALIGGLFQQFPEARYRTTQLAFVQEHALVEAQNRIKRLEWENQQLQQAVQQARQAPPQQSSGGGFFGGLFGGNRQQSAPPPGGPWNQRGGPQQQAYQQSGPPPQPQYAPGYQPGMFQQRGSGFLGSALTTAAGVAGGMVAGNALMNLFSGGHSAGLGGLGAGAASPWTTPAADTQYVDTSTWDSGAAGAAAPDTTNQDYVDNGSWDNTSGSGGGGFDDGGSWDSGGGSSDDTY